MLQFGGREGFQSLVCFLCVIASIWQGYTFNKVWCSLYSGTCVYDCTVHVGIALPKSDSQFYHWTWCLCGLSVGQDSTCGNCFPPAIECCAGDRNGFWPCPWVQQLWSPSSV